MSSAHGACLHVCAKTQVLSRTFVFIFCIDFRVDYESAVEGLSVPRTRCVEPGCLWNPLLCWPSVR